MAHSAQDAGRGPIIVGYDGSEASERALFQALDEARLRDVDVAVVVVAGLPYEMDPYDLGGVGAVYMRPVPPEGPIEIQPILLRAHKTLDVSGVVGTVEWAYGEPVGELIRIAGERHASAIVVGSHHHTALGRFLGTDTAAELTRDAPCDVVVAR